MQGTAEAATADLGAEPEQYVINLCASTTPMALVQPKSDALKRFTFFVSRRREDGRERFRLHMGYFASAEEAEEWLGVVRELYPAAWVGEAPGKKLRAAARAVSAAAPPAAPSAAPSAPAPSAELTAAPKPVLAPEPVPAPEPAQAYKQPAQTPPPTTAALSNVREVLAQLDEPAGDTAMHTLYVPPPPVLPEHIPTVQALTPAPMIAKAAPRREAAPAVAPTAAAPSRATAMPAAKPAVKPAVKSAAKPVVEASRPAAAKAESVQTSLSDTQVLRVLEERRADLPSVVGARTADERAAHSAIELLRPDDTRTMRALKDEVQHNAAVPFAVQLDWSVTPIDLSKVPPLAIFSAYTLYTVESSREGRKWFGLRLGFFSDALSAKQVAYYVRSDFTAVAVVPVTVAERDRAIEETRPLQATPRKRVEAKRSEEFKLFDVEPVPKPAAPSAQAVRARLAAAARPDRRPAGARSKPAVRKPARSLEESLEQTLEILGAGDLEIDKGRGELLNDSGVRHLSVKVDKRTSTFSKLLDRLADRVGKG